MVRVALVTLALVVTLGWYVGVPHLRPTLAPGEQYAIDVSHHQQAIDWTAVAADGIGYAYLKATEGQGYVDPQFAQNWRDSAGAGIRRGAYHYFTLCAPGARQAANFLRVAPPAADALAPAIDLEADDSCTDRPPVARVNAELAAFLRVVERAWRRPVVVYVRDSWAGLYPVAGSPLEQDGRPRWRTRFFLRPSLPWTVWQVHYFTRIDVIHARVDLDVVRPAALSAP
jgi:lysozyme